MNQSLRSMVATMAVYFFLPLTLLRADDCNGTWYDPGYQGCCYNQVYDTGSQVCCSDGSVVYSWQSCPSQPQAQTCGSTTYYPEYGQICCGDGSVVYSWEPCPPQPQTCGNTTYYPDYGQVCCGGVVVDSSDCCNNQPFDPNSQECCGDGHVAPRGYCGWATCGDQLYDPGSMACCNGTLYNPNTQVCCDGMTVTDAGWCHPAMCGGERYDPGTQECCNGLIVPTGYCCGGQVIDPAAQDCCDGSRAVAKGQCSWPTCNGVPYDSMTLRCSMNGTLYDPNSQQECSDGTVALIGQCPSSGGGSGGGWGMGGGSSSTSISITCVSGNGFTTGGLVTWSVQASTTDGMTHQVIYVGDKGDGGTATGIGSDFVAAELDGLQPGSTYYFYVLSSITDASGNTVSALQPSDGSFYSFHTMNVPKKEDKNNDDDDDNQNQDPNQNQPQNNGSNDNSNTGSDPANYSYCGGSVYDPGSQGCCNGTPYDLSTQECCGGWIVVPSGQCCNGSAYDPASQGCCNGQVYNLNDQECCSDGRLVSKGQCNPQSSPNYPDCNGNSYDSSWQGCCNGVVYDLNSQECCGGWMVVPTGQCCNGTPYDSSSQGCCNGQVYSTSWQECCSDGMVVSSGQCNSGGSSSNYAYCNGTSYDPGSQGCCNGQIYALSGQECCSDGRVVGSGQCNSGGTSYSDCNGASYDSSWQGCCNGQECCSDGRVVGSGQCNSGGSNYSDCNGSSYDPNWQGCCNGQIYTLSGQECCSDGRVAGSGQCNMQLCGGTTIDSSWQGCCNGIPYDPGTQECCGGMAVPLGQCCGGNYYDRDSHGCCNGQLYTLGIQECCGDGTLKDAGQCSGADCSGTSYDPNNQECCYGVVVPQGECKDLEVTITSDCSDPCVMGVGGTMQFTASVSGALGTVTYLWDFGGGANVSSTEGEGPITATFTDSLAVGNVSIAVTATETIYNGNSTVTRTATATTVVSVLKVKSIEVTSDVAGASKNPPPFDGQVSNSFDITKSPMPDKHMVVFYKDVINSSFEVQPFDISLKANVIPAGVTADDLSTSWSQISGPDSGSFDDTEGFEVKFQNPSEGGVYRFTFDTGISGVPVSEVNIVLPLAGAEVECVVGADIVRAEAFAKAVIAKYTWIERQYPWNGLRWFVNYGAGDYLGRPDNTLTPTVWAYNQINTSSKMGMGGVATWRGVPVRVAKLSNFIVAYTARRIKPTFPG